MVITNGITILNTVQRSNSQILTSEIGEDLVIMDIESGQYITFNKIARILWNEIETQVKVSELIKLLLLRFDVTEEACINDVIDCLNKMREQKLITLQIC